jgi:hypothetical protein
MTSINRFSKDNMPDNHPRLVVNSKDRRCPRCTGVHKYLTRESEDVDCSAPVAFSYEKALKMSNMLANGPRDVVRIPDNEVVVMDESARRLPRSGTGTVRLAQFSRVERSV